MLQPALTFDEPTHTYRVGGSLVPGVTQVLAPLARLAGIPDDVLEAKRRLGSQVHLACQLDDEDDLVEDSVPEAARGYLQAYRLFRRETGVVVVRNECRVYEPVLGYAGQLDRVLRIGAVQWLVDLKTSIATPLSAGPQTAAYLRALNDPAVTHRAALRLRADGTYRFDPLSGTDDASVFVACLTLHRFQEKHHG